MGEKKYLIRVILTIFFSFSFLLLIGNGKITFYSIVQDETFYMPEVSQGKEIESQGYKYSNHDNVFVSSPSTIFCRWKDPLVDDGYKICNTIFEIDATKNSGGRLVSPKIILNFTNEDLIKNIKIFYSEEYSLIKREFSEDITEEASNLNHGAGFTLSSNEDNFSLEDYSSEKIVVRREVKLIEKRQFTNFFNLDDEIVLNFEEKLNVVNIDNYSLEQDIVEFGKEDSLDFLTVSNDSKNETILAEVLLNETNETKEGLSLSAITGFFSKIIDEKSIDTSKPFAVMISFEVPTYEDNQFNFSIEEIGFGAKLDPDVSDCGILDTPFSTYTLSQDLDSDGSCLFIQAENITLDCSGKTIYFGDLSHQSYGVMVNASNTTIKNCLFEKQNELTAFSAGIFFDGSNNSKAFNNSFSIIGNYSRGIRIEDSSYYNLSENYMMIIGNYSHGVYITSNSSIISLINNSITTNGYGSIPLNIDISHSVLTENNTLITENKESYVVSLISSFNNNISNNLLLSNDDDGLAVYLYNTNNSRISRNNITSQNIGIDQSSGIYLIESHDNLLEENIISLVSSFSSGYTVSDNSYKNNFSHNIIETTSDESFGVYLENSFQSYLYNNTIKTLGNSSHGLILYNSTSNNISTLYSNTSGESSYGIYFDEPSSQNNLSNIHLLAHGEGSYSIYISFPEENLKIFDSIFNSTFENQKEIYFDSVSLSQNPGRIEFFNVSYESDYWVLNSGQVFDVYWYALVNVFSIENNPISGVSVLFKNSSGLEVLSSSTDYLGNVKAPLKQFSKVDNQNITDENNYTISISYLGLTNSSQINLTGNSQINLKLNYTSPAQSSSSGGGGGGGGSGNINVNSCQTEWDCSLWSECSNNKIKRMCTLRNLSCQNGERPIEEESCDLKGKEDKALFDIGLIILEENLPSKAKSLLAKISLLNIGSSGKTKVNLSYEIKDFNKKVVFLQEEMMLIETQYEFLKKIDISNLSPGTYHFLVNLSYEGQEFSAYSNSTFVIGKDIRKIYLYGLIILIVIFLIGFLFLLNKRV